ncbi:MAG: hypothetical protein BGP08_08710 [Rhizobiales bacterium 64-17]|nr:MAG: hypothetical protein BGP08_08710 [Rhizobiales bacterium 64-17]
MNRMSSAACCVGNKTLIEVVDPVPIDSAADTFFDPSLLKNPKPKIPICQNCRVESRKQRGIGEPSAFDRGSIEKAKLDTKDIILLAILRHVPTTTFHGPVSRRVNTDLDSPACAPFQNQVLIDQCCQLLRDIGRRMEIESQVAPADASRRKIPQDCADLLKCCLCWSV